MAKKTKTVVAVSSSNKSKDESKEILWQIVKENLEKKYGGKFNE